MDRRNFLKAGLLGAVTSGLPVAKAEAVENLPPIPGALGMLYDSTLCVGCQACVAECQQVNKTPVNPKGEQTWANNDKLTPFTRNVIQVWSDGDGKNKDKTENGYAYVKKQCMHCVDPNCVSVCPVQALTKDPKTGIVKYDPDICTGCRYCMVGCPFDVPKYDYDNPFGQISKCELCNQKGVERLDKGELPGCCHVCPTGAIIFGTREELLAEAKRRLALKIEKLLTAPTKEEVEKKQLEEMIFSQLLEEWKTIRSSEIKSSSYRSEMKSLELFMGAVGNLRISDYTTQLVQTYLMNLNVQNSTRKNRKIYLNAIFDYAVKVGYISDSPVKGVVIPKQKADYEKLQKAKDNFISREELGQVLSYCESHNKDKRYALAMEFIFLTGLRFAEFIGVRYQDVNFKANLLTIDHTIDYVAHGYDERILQTTKTVGSVRTIVLSERCLDIIEYFRSNCFDEEFIFVTEQGNIMRQPLLYRFIKSICEVVLGGHRSYNIHMLRHSHISLLAELGIPIKAIMERVGHRDESITLRIYSHVTKNIQDELREKLNQIHL